MFQWVFFDFYFVLRPLRRTNRNNFIETSVSGLDYAKSAYYIHWLLLFAVGPTSDEAYSENSNWFSPLKFHFSFRPFLISFLSPSKLDLFASVCAMISRNGVLQTKYRANKRQQNSLSLFLSDYFSLRLTRSNRKFQLFFFPP